VPLNPDTIAAIATAHGQGGIGVIRISGISTPVIAKVLLGRLPKHKEANFSVFRDAEGIPIDSGIALYFCKPNSFTGEDVLELQGHGGTAVLQLMLQRVMELGARLARPGEFTQRAFFNNKLDLAQAESVADLIAATTEQGARSAMRSLQGAFSQVINEMMAGLTHLRMSVEVSMDFPEENLDEINIASRGSVLQALQQQLNKTLSLAQQGSLLREGAQVVLVGQPNVGKSSLLNRLSEQDVALVSKIPGTTRDLIRQVIQIEGIPLYIIDTAGLRESKDEVEMMGMARTHEALKNADAVLVVVDASLGVTPQDTEMLKDVPANISRIYVFNKMDLLAQLPHPIQMGELNHVYLSAKTGSGIALLQQKLITLVGWHPESGVYMARKRHINALLLAQNHLKRAAAEIIRIEIYAEELRLAQDALGMIVGKLSSDDLLGEIFSRFCIGK
jgi:tRNA modification GTPase